MSRNSQITGSNNSQIVFGPLKDQINILSLGHNLHQANLLRVVNNQNKKEATLTNSPLKYIIFS